MLQDEVEEEVPAHEVIAGRGLLVGEEVKGEGVVKEEVVEEKDGAECGGREEYPLRILPEELRFKGEGLVKEEVMEMEDQSSTRWHWGGGRGVTLSRKMQPYL